MKTVNPGVVSVPHEASAAASSGAQYSLVTDLPGEEWDRLLTGFADPYYEQTHAYRGATWGEHRVRRLAVKQGGRIVAMALVLVFKVPLLGRGIGQTKFGPVWRKKGEPDDPAHLRLGIAGLIEQFVVKDRLSLTVVPPPDPRFSALFAEELIAQGFSHAPSEDEQRYLVDLTVPEAELRAGLSQTWRRNLKGAEKLGLVVREETTRETLALFDGMFREMEARKSYSNTAWPAFRDKMDRTFGGPVTPSIVLVEQQGKPIAGAVIGHLGETVYYLFGATSDEGVKNNAGYVMHWWIVNWLRQKNARWYDLGGAAGQSGLLQFKKGLAGKRGAVASLPGDFTLVRDPLSALVAKATTSAKTLMPKLRQIVASRREG